MIEPMQTELLYRTADGVRASFGTDERRALAYYADFVRFVTGLASSGRLLDVGCGSGWSTLAFTRAGFDATGIDLNPAAFEAPGCDLREGSALTVPFEDETFDVVATHQCLEHVPEPRLALSEMARVCKPGGLVIVVGPNLVSPAIGLLSLRYAYQRRTSELQHHPYGNTVLEVLAMTAVRSYQLLSKVLSRRPQFIMRQPDTVPPFHADNDACYLCCPSDLLAHFRLLRWTIERRTKPGRVWPLHLLAGGTWIAVRKPPRRYD
jgi:SAM-dependent methyltransferase